MKISYLPFDEIPGLSIKDVDLQLNVKKIADFMKYPADINHFEKVIKDKAKDKINRELLVKVLSDQYLNCNASDKTKSNISELQLPTTFTITTAHQPSFLTGPLYFIYKIFSCINLSEQLNEKHPQHSFVPIYVIGGEDHDFEEVNHVHLYGETYQWNSDQLGAVGRMDINGMDQVLETVFEKLGDSENATSIKNLIQKAKIENSTYGAFTLAIVRQLFDKYGLVCLNMDQKELKNEMIPIFQDEILNSSSNPLVNATQSKIVSAGYKNQVHSRDINLFYLDKHGRNRIIKEGDHYKINKTTLNFSENEIIEKLNNNAEQFSPNVILRPLYQEKILPNIVYVGGGGELAYWLELKNVFEKHQVNFPMLVRRDSVLLLNKNTQKLQMKTGVGNLGLFQEVDQQINTLLSHSYDLSLDEEKLEIIDVFEKILKRSELIDSSLVGLVESTKTKQLKAIDNINNKWRKASKQKEESKINQLRKLWNNVHPMGKLQERYDNFIPFYLQYGDEFMETLKANLNPMDKRFKIISLGQTS